MHRANDRVRPARRRAALLPGLILAACAAALAPACMFSIGETRSESPSSAPLCTAEGKTFSAGALYPFSGEVRVCRAGTWEPAAGATP